MYRPQEKPQRYDRDSKYEKYGDRETLEKNLEREAKIIMKSKSIPVQGFEGYYSGFTITHKSPVLFEGVIYPTVAHAFNAARTTDPVVRRRFEKVIELRDMY